MTLKPGAKDTFVFYASPSFMEKQIGERITVELTLENRFAQRYKETFVVIITSLSNKVFEPLCVVVLEGGQFVNHDHIEGERDTAFLNEPLDIFTVDDVNISRSH